METPITVIPVVALDQRERPCVYGCIEPLACPYEHRTCPHCAAVRQGSGWRFNPASIYEFPYLAGHPLPDGDGR